MNLVCYLPMGHELSSDLLSRLDTMDGCPRVEVVRGMEELVKRLTSPRTEGVALLAIPANRRELSDMQSMPALLRGIPLVIGLPDDDPETLAQARRLLPRYAAPLHSMEDFDVVSGVVARILRKYGRLEDGAVPPGFPPGFTPER